MVANGHYMDQAWFKMAVHGRAWLEMAMYNHHESGMVKNDAGLHGYSWVMHGWKWPHDHNMGQACEITNQGHARDRHGWKWSCMGQAWLEMAMHDHAWVSHG